MRPASSKRWKIAALVLTLLLIVAIGLTVSFWLRYNSIRLNYDLQATSIGFYIGQAAYWEQAASNYSRETIDKIVQSEDADLNATVCIAGIENGLLGFVLPACERAVELSPDNGIFHDYRGLARVKTGDFAEAIEDFTFYVEWLKENDLYEQYGSEREEWIAALEAGHDPLQCYSEFWQSSFTNPVSTLRRLTCRP